jgi:signal transduction histidine kinase
MAETAGQMLKRFRHVPWLVVLTILLVLAAAILLVTLHLRSMIGTQIIEQDGIALYAASMTPSSVMDDVPDDLSSDLGFVLEVIAIKVFEAATDREDVLDARVFNTNGNPHVSIGGPNERLSENDLKELRRGRRISRYENDADLSKIGKDASLREAVNKESDDRGPLIRALVPLHHKDQLIGAAEFILDGEKVQSALAKMDRDLWLYAVLIFVCSGGLAAGALTWAFGRLQHSNKLLAERTRSLLRANHELTLSAKTSAIGAITAHLIHDLKSPLFGLQSFVSARGSADDEDWQVALDTTQRMQKLIGEVVRIMQEERTSESYEMTVEDLLGLLRLKLEPPCQKAGLTFSAEGNANGAFMNRDGNIILLVATNIVQNAIQATPAGGHISVSAFHENGDVMFELRDSGPGLPKHVLATLFTPSRSTKSGGTGLGLAISKQLANHVGAELSLKESSESGTIFQLRVPERVLIGEAALS